MDLSALRSPSFWAPLLVGGLLVAACAKESAEPYPYEDDDDGGMFGGEGNAGSDGGGSTGSSTGGGSGAMDGDWKGNCIVSLYGYLYDFGLVLEVETDEDGELTGRGDLILYGTYYTGKLKGEIDGDTVDIWFGADSSGYEVDVTLRGEQDGDSYSGECTVVGYPGEFELNR